MKKRTNMSEPEIKRIRVAAIQMVCEEAKIAHNLEHAAKLLEQAVEKGAELVLFPELMPGGYMLTEAIWDAAETKRRPNSMASIWGLAFWRRMGRISITHLCWRRLKARSREG